MDKHVASRIEALCSEGYRTGNVALYGAIDDILKGVEQTELVSTLRRLASAGPTLSSPRFAFPHIADRLA